MLAASLVHAAQNDLSDPLLAQALEWLRTADFSQLDDGRHEIGNGIYANVMSITTASPSSKDFEAHRAYYDIHYVISGTDLIACAPISACQETQAYAEDGDAGLYDCPDETHVSWVALHEGELCLTPPACAHKPGLTHGAPAPLRKAVVKVPVA